VIPIVAVVALVLIAAWALLTQPFVARRDRGSEGPRADPRRLAADVERLVRLAPRDAAHPKNLDRAADELARSLGDAGAPVTELPFSVSGHRFRNVIGSFGPEGGGRVIVGAHYDAYLEFPGADDNASGVAGVLELARLLSSARLRGGIDLALWPLEEPPHFGSDSMGSSVHARSLADAGAPVLAMLSLEMIGCFRDEPGSQQLPLSLLKLVYPTTGSFIALAGRFSDIGLLRRVKGSMLSGSDLPVRSINAPQGFPAIDLSDHLSFWRAGYPALLVTDTAFYRNPRYHTGGDTPETLDYARMAKVVDGVFLAVLDLTGSSRL
jgi:peptidase M28-like protein